MSARLPFTPRAQPGESPLSLLRRAAHGNGLRSTLRHAYGFNSQLDHSATALGTLARNPDVYRATAAAMGIPSREVDAVIYARTGWHGGDHLTWNNLQVSLNGLSFRQAKTCVTCVQEKGYAMSEWDHRASVACATHHVLLETQCPVCHALWTHDEGLLACSCPLDEMRRRLVPVDAQAASLLSRLVAAKDQFGLALLSFVEKVLTWWSLLGLSLPPLAKSLALSDLYCGRWPTALSSSTEGQPLHPRIMLAPLLSDAPALARQLLQQPVPIINIDLPEHSVLASEAMSILGINRVAFAKLRRDRHVQEHPDGYQISGLNRLLVRTTGNSAEHLVPLAKLRTGPAHVSLSKILGNIEAGHITAFQCAPDCGLESLHASMVPVGPKPLPPGLITLADAAARLKVHPEYVRKIVGTGLLPATRGCEASGVQWLIQQEEIERFDIEYVFASALAKTVGASVTTFSSRLRSAGLLPVSGPGIDGGIAYLFRRSQVAHVDLMTLVASPYHSPAGRKHRLHGAAMETWTWHETARHLRISPRLLQQAVADGWLSPIMHTTRVRRFDPATVRSLEHQLASDYQPLQAAATRFGQSPNQFRRCWIDSGVIRVRRFGDQYLIAIADLHTLRGRREGLLTASEIARLTGRSRTLCSNLEKIGAIEVAAVIGDRKKKIKLYSRCALALETASANSGLDRVK